MPKIHRDGIALHYEEAGSATRVAVVGSSDGSAGGDPGPRLDPAIRRIEKIAPALKRHTVGGLRRKLGSSAFQHLTEQEHRFDQQLAQIPRIAFEPNQSGAEMNIRPSSARP